MSLLSKNSLLSSAQFEIEFRTKKIIETRIRFDFTGEANDKRELERHLRELAIAENHLSVLLDKFEGKETTQRHWLISGE